MGALCSTLLAKERDFERLYSRGRRIVQPKNIIIGKFSASLNNPRVFH